MKGENLPILKSQAFNLSCLIQEAYFHPVPVLSPALARTLCETGSFFLLDLTGTKKKGQLENP